MLSLIIAASVPATYFAMWITASRFLFRKWRTDGDWDLHERDDGMIAFLAGVAGTVWPVVLFIVLMAVAITVKQPLTATEERELRKKAERRAAEAEDELKRATAAANIASSHHRKSVRG